jgi:hypothetical protein
MKANVMSLAEPGRTLLKRRGERGKGGAEEKAENKKE